MIVRGLTKGTAVEWLAAQPRLKSQAAEVVVVGDWQNDIPMFKTGWGACL
jgi:hydroxymethylpyrimidine pyrophosphatase-like HAD family hydrolase